MTQYWLERAWLGDGGVTDAVLVTVEDGRFTAVETDVTTPPPEAERLAGLTIPGLANCHSHAFHRALRGRTQRGQGTFWTWREQMYGVAGRLTPDIYYELAAATYREMAVAGITSVGEFHYLHHGPDGTPYDEPNAMGLALIHAARDAGIRIALLDTCYLAAGIGKPLEGVQLRFGDRDVAAWGRRVEDLATGNHGNGVMVGAAIHSVRAVPRDQMGHVVAWASGRPLHAHLSEQVAENEACCAAYGLTPTQVLADAGALGPRTSVVHATHLGARDIELLGQASAYSCFCPTTERDLGDGIGPSRRLHDAGSAVTLGSDSHAVIDLFEEMRAVEMHERLAAQARGHWTAGELMSAASRDGHRSLGFDDAGRIAVGDRADLVTLDTRTPRTAGTGAATETAVFAASAADVVQVIADGRVIATGEARQQIGVELDRVVGAVWEERP
ncbi:MAG TPA: formimidoylglutamate deiminase [Nocardioidaceae bacterium]|nr:formimidoylglutamate deiminase [Nocardioidaceae bacterium]